MIPFIILLYLYFIYLVHMKYLSYWGKQFRFENVSRDIYVFNIFVLHAVLE